MIKLRINGKDIEAQPGSTVLEAAESHGIKIPNLCARKGLSPYGGCRLCLVEIKGRKGYLPACCTPVEDGLDIQADTPELRALRLKTLELILAEHPNACLICTEKENCDDYKATIRKVGETTGCVLCPGNLRCQLQEAAEALKIDGVRFPSSYRDLEVRRDDPFFDRNYNLCILCGRCVRVCQEVRGASAISFVFRGPQSVIGTAFDLPLLESGCQFCGACVDACPTGALFERAARIEGLAEDKRETICPLCGIGCGLEVEIKKGRILACLPTPEDPVNNGQACVKGRFILRDVVYSSRRILKPMVRHNGELQEASWDEALDLVAQKLKSYGVRDLALVVSSQLSLEDQYAAMRLVRDAVQADVALDTPYPLPFALLREANHMAGLEAWMNFEMSALASAKVVVVIEADVAVFQPIIWLNILKAVKKGARLVVLNPEGNSLKRYASFAIETERGGKGELLSQLALRLLELEPDEDTSWLSCQENLRPDLKLSLLTRRQISGVREEDLKAVARLLAENHPVVFLFGSSLVDQAGNETGLRALSILARLSGARVIPLPLEINERAAFELWQQSPINLLPLDQLHREIKEGRRKALYFAGEIPALKEKTWDFLVIQDSYLNDHIPLADVVLPAATFAETEGTFVNVEGRIRKFKTLIEPLGKSRSDWWIFSRLAQKLGGKDFDFKSPLEITEQLAKAVPAFGELSQRPNKKNRSSFMMEENKSARRPASTVAQQPAAGSPTEFSGQKARQARERYRSLDLFEASPGLKRLRVRGAPPSQKQSDKKESYHG